MGYLYMSTYPGIDPTGVTDSFAGLQNAFASLVAGQTNAGETLVVDCPIFVSQGTNWLRSLFIGSNISILGSDAGSIIYDGVGVPLFIFANAANTTIRNLKHVYIGTFGVTAISYGSNAVATFGAITGGSGYTNGPYNWVRLTGGHGGDCFATVTVTGGAVTAVALQGAIWGGASYVVGDSLTVANTYLGGTGSGFSVLVGTINSAQTAINAAVNNNINVTMQNYYTANYVAGVSGNQYTGGASPFGGGAINQCGTYQIRGATYNLRMIDCTFTVPPGAPACNFIPTVVGIGEDWTPGTITSATTAINTTNMLVGGSGYANGTYTNVPLTGGAGSQASANITVAGGAVIALTITGSGSGYAVSNTLSASNANLGGSGSGFSVNVATIGSSLRNPTTMAIPTDCIFQNVTFDGFCMGWVGASLNCKWINCTAIRYSEFQNSVTNDPLGNMVSLVGAWTAPPHWFYIANDNYFNSNIIIQNCTDYGQYVGTAVRRGIASGVITSLKCGLQFGTLVNGYVSDRAEGLMQVLTAGNSNGAVKNLYGTFYSTAPWLTKPGDGPGGTNGLIFPSSNALSNVTIQADITDLAPVPIGFPIGSDSNSAHSVTSLDLDLTTQDWPNVGYSVVNSAGITITATYQGAYPGFGFGGSGNVIKARVKFINFTNTAQTFRGVIANQGGISGSYSKWEVDIIGWRAFSGSNIDATKPRILIAGLGANANNMVKQTDVNNLMITEIKGAKKSENWTQNGVFTPAAGANYATSLVIPNSFSVTDFIYVNGPTPPAGPTSMSLGDSNLATRLLTGMVVTANGSQNIPRQSPIPLVNSPTTILLTANGSNFTGTGTIYVGVESQRTTEAE
jgi:hypothetical protein